MEKSEVKDYKVYNYDEEESKKYENEKCNKTNRSFKISFKIIEGTDKHNLADIPNSTDMIFEGQHIRYLEDALDYLYKKHGNVEFNYIRIGNIKNASLLYKLTRIIFKNLIYSRNYDVYRKYGYFIDYDVEDASCDISFTTYFNLNLFYDKSVKNFVPSDSAKLMKKIVRKIDGNFRRWNRLSSLKFWK